MRRLAIPLSLILIACWCSLLEGQDALDDSYYHSLSETYPLTHSATDLTIQVQDDNPDVALGVLLDRHPELGTVTIVQDLGDRFVHLRFAGGINYSVESALESDSLVVRRVPAYTLGELGDSAVVLVITDQVIVAFEGVV